VNEVIDQVQLEQDAQQGSSQSAAGQAGEADTETQTMIEDDNQQVQVESQISSDHKKSIVERFRDKVQQDEADSQKANQLVMNV